MGCGDRVLQGGELWTVEIPDGERQGVSLLSADGAVRRFTTATDCVRATDPALVFTERFDSIRCGLFVQCPMLSGANVNSHLEMLWRSGVTAERGEQERVLAIIRNFVDRVQVAYRVRVDGVALFRD